MMVVIVTIYLDQNWSLQLRSARYYRGFKGFLRKGGSLMIFVVVVVFQVLLSHVLQNLFLQGLKVDDASRPIQVMWAVALCISR